MILLVGALDYLSGYEFSTAFFYLGPVALVAWYAGRGLGLTASVVSAITWLVADSASGHVYSSPVFLLWSSLVRFVFFAVVTLLLVAQRQAHAEVLGMARTDFLTGVTNQRYFYELAQIEIDRSRRYRHPITLAYIDLDNFKDANDRLGHVTGDALLRVVAGHIRRNTRSVDVVARIGGDEFVLLLPETGVQPAQAAVSKIMSILTQAMRQNEWPVSFSIGVVTFLELPPALEEMLDMADSLMRSVKADSKNGVRFSVYPGLPAA